MSSATSTSPSTRQSSQSSLRAGLTSEPGRHSRDDALRPWQFFLLAGMLAATGVVLVSRGQSPASIIVLSLTVVAASLVAVAAHRALVPLVTPEQTTEPATTVGRTRAWLEREKTLVLRSIKELEFDFAMGKVSKSDFDEMSARLRSRAIRLMRQLDAGASYKSAIEQELRARMSRNNPAAGLKPGAAGDGHVATGDGHLATSPRVVCRCGVINDPDARYCKHCGTHLVAS